MIRCELIGNRLHSRRGLTIVEVLVVVAILSALISLIAPAVQYSRATARKASCQNNLKQFGLALAGIESQSGAFPTAIARSKQPGYLRLLPYFDAHAVSDALAAKTTPDSYFVPGMICPDDPVAAVNMVVGESNYYFNKGTKFFVVKSGNGFMSSSSTDTKARDVSDGLSQTIAMSERLVRPLSHSEDESAIQQQAERELGRYLWWTKTRYNKKDEELLAASDCESNRTTPFPMTYGANVTNYTTAGAYDHLLPPNHCGCYNGPEDFFVDLWAFVIPASSNHSGGVNSLVADGSVRFVSDDIDLAVWRSLGTRNGADTVVVDAW